MATSKKLGVLGIIAACFLLGSIACWHAYQVFKVPMLPCNQPPSIIRIDKATSAYEFAHILKNKQYIHSSSFFIFMMRLLGLTHQLKAGVYQIQPGESAMHLLHKVVAGEVLTHNFTIIAGSTQAKIAQDLKKAIQISYHAEDWDLVKQEHPNAEGLLLAETYQYPAESSSKVLLGQAHQALLGFLNASWQTRALNLPYKTPYELLIAASIIEKESALAAERQLISGVLVNRLKKGMPLQMDPTVIYALATTFSGKLSHNDLLIDSPYNSYRHKGLPPTPIAMVGKEAILAAAHPHDSNYLYFVAKGDGTHQFSETYIQQRQAIHQYQHKDS